MSRPFLEGFPFAMSNLRAYIVHLNLYDVQSGIYNSITVLFERSAGRFLQGGKIEVIPYFIPHEEESSKIAILLIFRIIGLLWTAVLSFITLSKKSGFKEILSW